DNHINGERLWHSYRNLLLCVRQAAAILYLYCPAGEQKFQLLQSALFGPTDNGKVMPMKTLSQDAVRGLMIAAQGLQQCPPSPASKADVRQIIRQMHVLQIDTIHVVARSPYLVLWSRLGGYAQDWLDELLAEGTLFEYWSHAACFLPTEDYPLYR